MQDRFAGDVGDYGKFALLKILCQNCKLGVVWYLVPDETHTHDGKFTNYAHLKHLEPGLFWKLQKVLKGKRSVRAVQKSGILTQTTVYYDPLLSFKGISPGDRLKVRAKWVGGALEKTRKCQIVFLDPDNSIEPQSIKSHHLRGPKFVYLDEVKRFFERGQSLIIYHHLGRKGDAENQIEEKTKQISKRLQVHQSKVIAVRYRRGTSRVFFIVIHKNHESLLRKAIDLVRQSQWVHEGHCSFAP